MTALDWVRSIVIFVAAVFILNNFFISLTVWESIVLTIFTAVCIVHTMDVRDDLIRRAAERRLKRKADDVDGG